MVRAIEVGATLAGYLVRTLLYIVNVVVAAAPFLLIIYGTWLIYQPASYVVTGLILFLLNSRPKDRRDK